jgi:hypothetical protein
MGHIKIDLATKQLISSRPVLLGGKNSSNPVQPDAAVARAIEELAGPVKKMQSRVVGACLFGGSRSLGGCLLWCTRDYWSWLCWSNHESHARNERCFPPAGKTTVTLIGGNAPRQMETNFGDYLASLMVKKSKSLPGFEAKYGPVEIGYLTGGGIRSDVAVSRGGGSECLGGSIGMGWEGGS